MSSPGRAAKTRILLVDDAALVRRFVTQALEDDPSLQVVGTAPNGRIALSKLAPLQPEIVVLDLEMPDMDGLETLAHLRLSHPHLPVIMFSRFTSRGSARALEALAAGATECVAKPDEAGGPDQAFAYIQAQLIPKIKRMTGASRSAASHFAPAKSRPSVQGGPRAARRPEVLAIASSTGGPNALAELLAGLPASFPAPVLIAQHMPPMFTRLLAEQLSGVTPLTVREAQGNECLAPGHVWIAPGDYHLEVVRDTAGGRLRTHQGASEHSCRPSGDVLLRSVAAAYGGASVAVVLTGMGRDGRDGCERIRAAGGAVLVQDEASSVVWGMPGQVARDGLADIVAPPAQLAVEITRRFGVLA